MIPGFVGFRRCFGGWLLLFGFGGYVCVCGFRVVGFGCMIYLMVVFGLAGWIVTWCAWVLRVVWFWVWAECVYGCWQLAI